MKLKIQTISKEEKIKVYKEYLKTSKGKEQIERLKRLLFIGILSVCVSIFLLTKSILDADKWYNYTPSVLLLIFGTIFIISSIKLKTKSLNNFYVKRK